MAAANDDPGFPQGRLGARFLVGLVVLVAVATAARVAWFSGLGLGDDMLLRWDIRTALHGHSLGAGPNGYRFPWWLPTTWSCRLLGLTEIGIIVPIVVYDALGLGVVGLLGALLAGPAAGLLATAIVAATPLDFAWATMLTTDIPYSFWTATAMLLGVVGLRRGWGAGALVAYLGAGVSLWLAIHAKLSGLALAPLFAILAWRYRRRLTLESLAFPAATGVLVVLSGLVAWSVWGSPLASLDAELKAQGLVGDVGVREHPLTRDLMLVFPNLLLFPNYFGNLVFGIVPWAVITGLVVGRWLGARVSPVVFWWIVVVALGLEFNVQRANGVWVAGFRNVRHMHPLVYPLALALACQLVGLGRRHRPLAALVGAGVLAIGGWQSLDVADKTVVSFADRRAAAYFLLALPVKPVYGDFQLEQTVDTHKPEGSPLRVAPIKAPDREGQRVEIAALRNAYLVTGGGREPYYGCTHCIPSIQQLDLLQWRLLYERPEPPATTSWRSEPLRIWEAVAR